MKKKKRAPNPAQLAVAAAIRRARRACRLTQKQLGQRLGLKGSEQAVYRWECGTSAPTARNVQALLGIVATINATAASELDAAIAHADGSAANPSLGAARRAAEPTAQARAAEADRSEQRAALDGEPQSALEDKRVRMRRPLALDYLVLRMAEQVDVPPRRLRRPLLHLLRSLQANDFALGGVLQDLAACIERMDDVSAASEEPERFSDPHWA